MKKEDIKKTIKELQGNYLKLMSKGFVSVASEVRREIDIWEVKLRNYETNHNIND